MMTALYQWLKFYHKNYTTITINKFPPVSEELQSDTL